MTELTDQKLSFYDINDLIAKQNEIKSSFQKRKLIDHLDMRNVIAQDWESQGDEFKVTKTYVSAEICYFIAHLYLKSDIKILQKLIIMKAKNRKYNEAIELLKKLYDLVDESSKEIFLETTRNILPENLNVLDQSIQEGDLEEFLIKRSIDLYDPFAWFVLAVTLQKCNKILLADQAFENAIGLKILGAYRRY